MAVGTSTHWPEALLGGTTSTKGQCIPCLGYSTTEVWLSAKRNGSWASGDLPLSGAAGSTYESTVITGSSYFLGITTGTWGLSHVLLPRTKEVETSYQYEVHPASQEVR